MRKIQIAVMVLSLAGAMNTKATLEFTTESSFLGAIQPGYYLNDFNAITTWAPISSPQSYSGGPGFNYTISSSPGSLWGVIPSGNGAMSTEWETGIITVNFTSGNVTAVGGKFFLTDYSGAFIGGNIRVTLSDSTVVDLPSTTGLFHGFATSSGGPVITSVAFLSLSTGKDNAYPTIDHLYAASVAAVPEPTTMLAGALLLLPFGVSTLRILRRKHAA